MQGFREYFSPLQVAQVKGMGDSLSKELHYGRYYRKSYEKQVGSLKAEKG